MKIREDLIQKELDNSCIEGAVFKKLKPSNRFIDWLFRRYYVHEHTEHFYDSEPDFEDEEFNMYLDYEFIHKRIPVSSGTAFFNTILHMDDIAEQKENFRYSEEEHTFEELEQAYNKITKQIEDYKSRKIEFNNWIEPYFNGNWGVSQTTVDRIARRHLERIKKCPVSYNGRLFITEKEDTILIYYYGRDFVELDYWWIFKKKPTKKTIKGKDKYVC